MAARAIGQTVAWIFLIGATLLSLWSAEHFRLQSVAIAASMAIAAVKVIVVLRRFMDCGRLTTPMKLYFYAWPIGCAAMILVFAVAS